ncbi:MAG: hypothetical protein JO108_09620 [Acidobacteriaceae bacterium]|nr:hypothetical protein [Acidobacteriaceae bacterium]
MARVRTNSRGSTGPKTPVGKKNSSGNSTKHGCTSKALLLPDEVPAEWEALLERWMADYRPDSATFADQVRRAAEAEWQYVRAARRYNQAEHKSFERNEDPVKWTAKEHRLLDLFGRYRTTAQRWFHRERQAAEMLRKARVAAEMRAEEASRTAANRAGEGRPQKAEREKPAAERVSPAPTEKQGAIVQDVEVWVDEQGQTVTVKVPPDEDVRRSAERQSPPVLIRRPVYFRGAIPPEYSWIAKSPESVKPGSRFYITMPFEEWELVAAREAERGDGHLWGEPLP